MVRGRSSGSGRSHSWSSTSGYTGASIRQEQHSNFTERACESHLQQYEKLVQKYGRDGLASTTTRELLIDECGAYVDPDVPSRVPQDQREKYTRRSCESHLEKYEELLLTYGRDSMASTTIRESLIYECGAYVDPDKPSSVPKGRRYRPTQFQCKLHLQKFEELVQKFGRDSLAVITNRELLIDKCGMFL